MWMGRWWVCNRAIKERLARRVGRDGEREREREREESLCEGAGGGGIYKYAYSEESAGRCKRGEEAVKRTGRGRK